MSNKITIHLKHISISLLWIKTVNQVTQQQDPSSADDYAVPVAVASLASDSKRDWLRR